MELIDFSFFASALNQVLSLWGIFAILIGVIFGVAVGAIPGMSPSMGVALLVPFSYGTNPEIAFLLFVSAYQAANYGGSITAIAINTPGTPASVVTALDGYELTRQGKANMALKTAVFASTLGGLVGCFILIFFTIPIAKAALAFGSAEYFALAVFGLSTVVAFGQNNYLKSLIAVLLGLLIGSVGDDPFLGIQRFTFGEENLMDGVAIVPALIGLFAFGEVFSQIYQQRKINHEHCDSTHDISTQVNLSSSLPAIFRSSILGTFIGVIPGAGATIASFVSYGLAKKRSKKPEEYGNGSLEGLAASEAANSSSVGGALIPLLALGIPGSATDAVLLGALTLHGLVAGPGLMQSDPNLVYGIFIAVIVANFLILLVGSLGNKLWLCLIKAPQNYTLIIVSVMAVLGSYTVHGSIFDVYIAIAFGLLGFVCKQFSFPPAAVILGLVLAPMIEMNLRRALLAESFTQIIFSPLSGICLALTLLSLLSPLYKKIRSNP